MKIIKTENDLLGLLIKLKNSRNDVRTDLLVKKSNIDSVSLQHLMQKLINNRYIIYSHDVISVTSLGINNYVSTSQKIGKLFLNITVVTIKEIIIFSVGVLSGLLVNYISHILNLTN